MQCFFFTAAFPWIELEYNGPHIRAKNGSKQLQIKAGCIIYNQQIIA